MLSERTDRVSSALLTAESKMKKRNSKHTE